MDEEELIFELKNSGDYLKIITIRLFYPDAEIDWDRNFIQTKFEVKCGAFSGQFYGELFTFDFENFKQELQQLYKDLKSQAKFISREPAIDLKISGDGIGHLKAECILQDVTYMTGNRLYFEMDGFDQTFIPDMIRQLDLILKKFPVTLNRKI